MNTRYIDKLAWIDIKNNQLLTTRSRGKDTWYIPGGKREPGESDTQALIREIKEELSVDLRAETIKYYGTFEAHAHRKPPGTIVRMTCYTADYKGTLEPSAEIEAMQHVSYDFQKTSKISPVDELIFDDLKMKNLIE